MSVSVPVCASFDQMNYLRDMEHVGMFLCMPANIYWIPFPGARSPHHNSFADVRFSLDFIKGTTVASPSDCTVRPLETVATPVILFQPMS